MIATLDARVSADRIKVTKGRPAEAQLPGLHAPRVAGPAAADETVALDRAIREDIKPRTAIEHFLCDLAARRAAQLRSIERSDEPVIEGELAIQAAMLDALAAVERVRRLRGEGWGAVAPVEGPAEAVAPIAPEFPAGRGRPVVEEIEPVIEEESADDDPRALYRDRLEVEPAVSQNSPVVRGTTVTVRKVISLIVDGRSWAEVVRLHPELSVDDVRACVAYTIEEEGGFRA